MEQISNQAAQDSGLSLASYMNKVYMWMFLGLLLTAGTAAWAVSTPSVLRFILFNKPVFYGLLFAEIAMVWYFSKVARTCSNIAAMGLYTLYAATSGLTFSVIFLVYTYENISNVFLITAGMFAGLSVFGYTTKRDLGPIGQFCLMGLFGMIIVMLMSFFLPAMMASTFQLTISAIGVLVFSGLTAWDTQKIKQEYLSTVDHEHITRQAVNGALVLYLDFVNLFLYLLRLLSRR